VPSAAAGASGGGSAGFVAEPRAVAGDVTARRAPPGVRASEDPPARPVAALPAVGAVGASAGASAPAPSAAAPAPRAPSSGSSAGVVPAPAAPPAPKPAPDTAGPQVVARAAEVSVVKTVWHPSAERRVAHVTVAGRDGSHEVREGDFVEGLEVREIKLSGVVFERGGVEIERRVQGRR
jgi:hypothetical protein